MAEKEYILFCDESERSGKFYSNFYGGVMVASSVYEPATQALNGLKRELNLFGEVKWEKVTERYLDRYVRLIQLFFTFMRQGGIRLRVMFRQNANEPIGLTHEHRENEYFLLYYQFIKHGFQLAGYPVHPMAPTLRLYFDQFPDTKEKATIFKDHLLRQLGQVPFRVLSENMAEVRSHDHVLLQCLDIVMGSMAFRLNDKHKEKISGTRSRGKRTKAKEALYKVILKEIQTLHPRFNIGMSTGGGRLWETPYAHWNFIPRHREINPSRTKHGVK
jgi:hypothetical protein